jgi:hypothetical protein
LKQLKDHEGLVQCCEFSKMPSSFCFACYFLTAFDGSIDGISSAEIEAIAFLCVQSPMHRKIKGRQDSATPWKPSFVANSLRLSLSLQTSHNEQSLSQNASKGSSSGAEDSRRGLKDEDSSGAGKDPSLSQSLPQLVPFKSRRRERGKQKLFKNWFAVCHNQRLTAA